MSRKAHLLLVDDDLNTLASLSRAFRMAGHEVTVCDNATRALESLRSEAFDLVFSDVVMSGKTGLDLLEENEKPGLKDAHHHDLRPGQHRNGGTRYKAWRAGLSGKLLSTDKLLLTIENALRLTRLEK